jgi:hypothetical protein
MLIWLIVSTSIAAIAHATAFSRICTSNSLRFFSVSFFESFNPSSRHFGARITAAATTGPNIGPRPTSSIPAIRRAPHFRAARSSFHPHTGDGLLSDDEADSARGADSFLPVAADSGDIVMRPV